MHDRAMQADRQNRFEDRPAAGAVRLPDLHRPLSSRDSGATGRMRAPRQLRLVRRVHATVTDTVTDTMSWFE